MTEKVKVLKYDLNREDGHSFKQGNSYLKNGIMIIKESKSVLLNLIYLFCFLPDISPPGLKYQKSKAT